MARDEAEEEAEFLADLKLRSGQDLAGWMAAITAEGFTDKNQTIDWLRAQGFPFARASWLERIHSNGGRPIYLDAPPAAAAAGKPADTKSADARPEAAPQPVQQRPISVPPTLAPDADEPRRLDALVAAAKGYRPLYMLLDALIRAAVPEAAARPRGTYIAFLGPHEFAAVLPSASELRLGLDLGARPHDANLTPARIKGAPAAITHMLVLKDARQINAELQALIVAAHASSAARRG